MDERTHALTTLERELGDTLGSRSLLEDRDRFRKLVGGGMTLLALDDSDVADKLPVSRSAVNRWRNGTAVPLPMMRKPVYQLLLRKVRKALQAQSVDVQPTG